MEGSWPPGDMTGQSRWWDLQKLSDPDEFNDDPLALRGHQQSVTSVAFSPCGRFLVSGSTDNTVRIWTLELEELADRVCGKVSRSLSWEEWEKSIGLGVKYQCTCPELPRGEGVPQDA
jgi:WD40 repeat protein